MHVVEGILISVFSVKHWVKSCADRGAVGVRASRREGGIMENTVGCLEKQKHGGNRLRGASWSRQQFTVTPTVLAWAFPL